MKKTRYCLLVLVILSFHVTTSFGQYSKLEVRMHRFYSAATNERTDGDIEHTWKLLFRDDATPNFVKEWCHSKTTSHNTTNIWYVVDVVEIAKTYYSSVPTTFYFQLRGYEDDAGYRCEEDGRDEQKENYPYSISLKDFSPGVWSPVYRFGGGRYEVEFSLRYTPVAPTVQTITPNTALICADAPVTLTPAINLSNKTGLRYQWQYNIQGEEEPNPSYSFCVDQCYYMAQECEINGWGNCEYYYYQCPNDCANDYPPLPVWKDLDTSGSEPLTITPTASIFPGGLNYNRGVQFRAKAFTTETSSAYGPSSGYRSFSPPAPSSSSSPEVTQPSCVRSGTGIIVLDNISKAFSTYRYILKIGDVATLGCEPQLDDCLTNVAASGESASSRLVITGLFEGTYSLFLLNPGGNEGVCPRRIGKAINVGRIPALNVSLATPSVIACNGENTGSIAFTVADGRQGNIDYVLLKETDPDVWAEVATASNPTLSFGALWPGHYRLKSDDGCTEVSLEAFTITTPARITSVEFEETPASCNVPGNGAMRVKVSRSTGAYVTSVSNLYVFGLFKDGDAEPFRTAERVDDTLTWQSLPPGSYELVVTEKGGDVCSGFTKAFTISPSDPLKLEILDVKHVSCFNGSDGQIVFEGTGGTGAYAFYLSGDQTASNTEGTFTNLKAGNYSITMKNQLAGCSDSFSTAFSITQPTQLLATAAKTDITCFDQNDGTLTGTVRGGAEDYTYAWQTRIDTDWMDMSATDSSLYGRQEGVYRLVATDKNQCHAISNTVTIVRPEPLVIDSVKVIDIKCIDETGNIHLYGSGGTAPLTFEYTPEASAVFSAFTFDTPIAEGSYQVRLKDTNGCMQADDTHIYKLTAPDERLDFTFEQSSYNGYNVSCFKGSNGTITLTPTGGNGSAYSGYAFRVDSKPFSMNSKLADINAGSHPVSVRDGRGCIVTKSVNFTEAPELVTRTTFRQDVNCHGDSTGILELEVLGGAGSFEYSIGNTTQPSPRFEGLHASAYTINITDLNDCSTEYKESIINLHAPIESELDIRDVQCNGGDDGAIAVTVTGGASLSYTYELAGRGTTTNPIQGLKAGIYDVTVKDEKGCTHEVSDVAISEPALLIIDSVKYQDIVCAGETGTIGMFASGGTSPYVFEYDSGIEDTFTPFNETTPLTANTYQLHVVDDHGCITPYDETITISNPPAPLDFTFALSDYNGFNISCYGGDNGFITLTAMGGNGVQYAGYAFAMDGRAFQTHPTIKDVSAGTHNIHVRDARNCVVTKNIAFTQSDNQLIGGLISKKDVDCFYEQTGALHVSAEGGVSPYRYAIDSSTPQQIPSFANLGVGDYVVTILDKNDCVAEVPVQIASLNPMFTIASEVSHVNCFGGQDGAVSLSVTGGVAPFTYYWLDQTSDSHTLGNIGTGIYAVTVTDQAGCFVGTSVHVDEPDRPLAVSAASTAPACYGQDNGMILIDARGGTSPYAYSINDGNTYHETASIHAAVGDFDVVVRDYNGCTASAATTVTQRNIRPEPNFLVSSKQNAMDTLVLTDISVPKPDSIHWSFDINTIMLNDSEWTPEISFRQEGDYPVTMTGYFGDCAYDVTKTIFLRPFDPDAKPDDLPDASPIQFMEVTPNPSSGDFTVVVKLNKKRNLSLIVYSVVGNILYENHYEETDAITQYVDISANAASGLYVIRAITASDARDVRIVVNR